MALTDGIKNKLKNIANAIRSKTDKIEELTLEQMASEINGIYSPKAEEVREVTIDANGISTIRPSEGYDVMESVEVNTRVSGEGYDFTTIGYTQEESNEINSLNTEGIRVAKEIMDNWNPQLTTISYKYQYRNDIVFFPVVDMSNITNVHSAFRYCSNLKKIKLNMPKLTKMINMCYRSGIEDVELTIPNKILLQGLAYYSNLKKVKIKFLKKNENDKLTTSFNTFAYFCGVLTGEDFIINNNSEDVLVIDLYYAFRDCFSLKTINFVMDLSLNQSTKSAFTNCQELQYIRIKNWGKYDLQLQQSIKLSAESIKYIIWHALNGENNLGFENQGATSRTLQLHATPYESWETWKLTKPSVDDCEFLGISEEEITKYGDLTWEDIALHVKLITIAK